MHVWHPGFFGAMRAHRAARLGLAGLALGASTLAWAQTSPVDARNAADTARIQRVTVYPGSATVERVARVVAGARSLTLHCLPAALDVQSLQIQADAAVRVGEFNVLTQDADTVSACDSPLDGRIREVEDQIAAVKAEAAGLQLVDHYLHSVAGTPPKDEAPSARASSPTPAHMAATSDALRRSGQDTFLRIHQLKRREQALESSLKPLLAERERAASQREKVVSVTVNLAAERDAELRVSYQVRGPGWQPSYRATLQPASAQVQIERLALVAQSTGEDWSQVQLVLSTGQPGRATQARLPRAWTLDIAPPPVPEDGRLAKALSMQAMGAAPAPALASSREQRALTGSPAEPMPSFEVSASDRAYATEFAVPQRISVPTNGQRVTLSLGQHTAAASVLTRTTPAVEEAAYLVAHVPRPPGVWPAGTVALYRDGAFVGQGRIDFSASSPGAPAGSAALSFGRDELVSVRAEPAQDLTGSAGFVGSRTERKTQRLYSVDNRHRSAITLQVLHAAPVSRNEKIEVESRYQPQPAELAWNRSPGTIAWQQSLPAGSSAQFSAEHTIRYPKEIELQERQ